MPPGCFSFTAHRDNCYRRSFSSAGLRSASASLPDGHTTVHWWIPRRLDPSKPSLLLLHGFGANAMWQWGQLLRPLLRLGFNLFVPDLLFFGSSHSSLPERSETFQAECVAAAMPLFGVERTDVVGISYGGFVAYRLAAMYPGMVAKVVLCCTGVCLEERDLAQGLFVVDDVDEAAGILLPQTPGKLRHLMSLSFVKPQRGVPSCFLADFIHVMCTEYVEEKTELIRALVKDRKLSDLPRINQSTLIIWGEQDKIFPLELGHRLNRHLEGNSQLVVIKNAGHAVNLERPKEFHKYLKTFLVEFPTNFNINHKESSTIWRRFPRDLKGNPDHTVEPEAMA